LTLVGFTVLEQEKINGGKSRAFSSETSSAAAAAAASQRASGERQSEVPNEAAYTLNPYDVTGDGIAIPCDQRTEEEGVGCGAGDQAVLLPEPPIEPAGDTQARVLGE
jgi:hypothetical protein